MQGDPVTSTIASSTPPRRRRMTLRAERWLQLAFVVPAALYLVLFFGYPIVQNGVMSFQEFTTRTFFTGEAPWVGWYNYVEVISSPGFGRVMMNTAIFTVVSIVAQFVIGLALAVFFRRRFPLSGVVRSLLLLPWLIPLIVSSAIWRWMLDKDSGVINQVLSGLTGSDVSIGWLTDVNIALPAVILVNVWLGIPFNMTILYSGLQDIPEELYEAAALDGATGWRAFWAITWPMLRPVTGVVVLLGVVYTLKALDIILGLTGGGPAGSTETLATEAYRLSFGQFDFGAGAAVGNILIVISLIFAVLYLRANRKAVDE
ncbi:carbohydrate ABC transporter permease [Microbacterium sp. WCS2018Hpa-23]|uniref:carbohydrate ABC transporter permease n=1 Tax=Microbacterium sp. WCS2018Hpa-23 TaxID=3073634 RepID=UPI0037CC74EF